MRNMPGRFCPNIRLDLNFSSCEQFRVNIIRPLFDRLLPLLEERFPSRFRRRHFIRRPMEIQLEFPWLSKK